MRIRTVALAAVTAAAAAQTVAWMNRWGATDEEVATVYPGDELIPDPAVQATMAVTVEAAPERIWPWLVQIGQDRGGMYSYDWLEQLIGLEITSAQEIRQEWQQLAPGDRVQLVPRNWGPLPNGYAFKVAQVDPPNALVLRQGPPEDPWDGVWSFLLRPAGPDRTRLVSRTRTAQDTGVGATLLRGATTLGVPVTWLMTRKMLLTLKERAERP